MVYGTYCTIYKDTPELTKKDLKEISKLPNVEKVEINKNDEIILFYTTIDNTKIDEIKKIIKEKYSNKLMPTG